MRKTKHQPRRTSAATMRQLADATTAEGLKAVRIGRPMHGRAPKQLVTIRVDVDLLDTIKRQADERGIGYQILMQDYLTRAAAAVRANSRDERRAPAGGRQ